METESDIDVVGEPDSENLPEEAWEIVGEDASEASDDDSMFAFEEVAERLQSSPFEQVGDAML